MISPSKGHPPPKIVLSIFLAVAMLQIPAELIVGGYSAAWGILINEILFILLVPVLILLLCGYNPLPPMRMGRIGKRRMVVAVCMTLGGAVLISYAQSASLELVRIPAYLSEGASRPMEIYSWKDFYLKLLLLGLLAPVCEETLFRGIIQTSLARSWGDGRAILVTAVFFTLIHSATFQPHLYLMLGLLLSWIYAKTRSLRTVILCHAINNSWVLANRTHGFSLPIDPGFGATDLALISSGAFIVAAGAFWMHRMGRNVGEARTGISPGQRRQAP
ncbi:MAG TPA: CPBP family intramembrane metalloprotease [bacterium]|nr:CPBP family intramembrane metalloprotease [bacterium]